MHVYELRRSQWVPKPRERLFPFFARAENLALITPPSLAFEVLTPTPVPMAAGQHIDYTIRLLGLRVRWRTLISAYDPPHGFVDEQLRGPYAFWHHAHHFEPVEGGTLIRDVVRYALPRVLPGPLRVAVHDLYVRPYLEAIFDYRRGIFTTLFAAPDGPEPAASRAQALAGQGVLS